MFKNPASEFVFIRTYARWIESKKRRETWEETVDRYLTFLREERGSIIPDKVFRKAKKYILNLEVMPSMRALWAAGEAARVDNTTMYNCSGALIRDSLSFSEALYILMCGTGDGYVIQKVHAELFPIVPTINLAVSSIHSIEDNRKGWADSIKLLFNSLYEGKSIEFDYSLLRPKGARLLTMGGRSSGPAPLIELHSFIRETFLNAQGRKLTTLELSDIRNQVADTVVVGGVRRSSQIAFSDLDDTLMAKAKQWPFPPRRAMANHSVIYNEKPSATLFLREWATLASSGTGERGISNFYAARKNCPERRDASKLVVSNPCHEVMLRDKEFCNLSEVVVREEDDVESLLEKVETATWLGCIQSTFTFFPYLSEEWKKNCEEERLLGVSLTGQFDNPKLLTEETLRLLKKRAIRTAKHASAILNINMPAAITTVKPSGTVSQLVDSSSGIHPRYDKFYIRRYRISAIDPLAKLLRDQGLKLIPENGQESLDADKVTTWVVEFPIKAPEKSIVREEVTAIDQLEWYKKIQTNWCEHNASMTVYVKDHEWFEVGAWVYKNWDIINGVSFLPYDGGHYKLAPYESITEKEYNKLVEKFPKLDYSQLSVYELEDNTEGAKSYNCTGDRCEIV